MLYNFLTSETIFTSCRQACVENTNVAYYLGHTFNVRKRERMASSFVRLTLALLTTVKTSSPSVGIKSTASITPASSAFATML